MKMEVTEIGYDVTDWIQPALDRIQLRTLVNTAMNFWVPLNINIFLTRCIALSFRRRSRLHGVPWSEKARTGKEFKILSSGSLHF
jgi:hypothetical protein